MDGWLAALLGVVGGGVVALGGRFIDRRRGIPSEVDAAIDSHVKTVIATLETRIKYLEASEQDCKLKLQASADQLAVEVTRGDRLEAQVNRLLAQVKLDHPEAGAGM